MIIEYHVANYNPKRYSVPVEFCRPVAEFLDGRFVEVAS